MEIDSRLAKISPNWYKKIIQARTLAHLLIKSTIVHDKIEKSLDMQMPFSCLVGESHGFKSKYYESEPSRPNNIVSDGCPKCTFFSNEVYHIPVHRRGSKAFRETVSDYLDHVQTDHEVDFALL